MFYFKTLKLDSMTVQQNYETKLSSFFFVGREHHRRYSASGGDDFGARRAGESRVRIPAGPLCHIQADGFRQFDRQDPVVEAARLLLQEPVLKVCLFRVI